MQRSMSILRLFAAIALCFFTTISAAQMAGRDYQILKQPQPTDSGAKIEVIEFFWYGCPHCNSVQSPLHTWLKRKPADVEFKRFPAVFQESWVPLTRLFYTLDAMGLLEKLHLEVFAAVHDKKVRLQDQKVLFDWIASKGVDRQKFIDTYNSFAVQTRTQRTMDVTRSYDIQGTPAFVVNGRYITAPSMVLRSDNTIDYYRFFKVLDQLIALARKSPVAK